MSNPDHESQTIAPTDSTDPTELTRLTADQTSSFGGFENDIHPSAMDQHNSTEIGTPASNQDQRIIRNGHLDPVKRARYLFIFIISTIISLLGLLLILIWIFKLRPKPGISFSNAPQLTNLHPILMYTFMATLNMYSVLIYRTHYDKPKGILKYMHAIIMGTCLIVGVLGVIVIFRAHALDNAPDWYSLHSWIGTLTLVLYFGQFVAGFVAFLTPSLTQKTRASLMPWHRILGTVLMILAATAVVTGIAEFAIFAGADYKKFLPITFVANFAGICVVLSAIGMGYLLTEPSYLRPPRPDEEQPGANSKR